MHLDLIPIQTSSFVCPDTSSHCFDYPDNLCTVSTDATTRVVPLHLKWVASNVFEARCCGMRDSAIQKKNGLAPPGVWTDLADVGRANPRAKTPLRGTSSDGTKEEWLSPHVPGGTETVFLSVVQSETETCWSRACRESLTTPKCPLGSDHKNRLHTFQVQCIWCRPQRYWPRCDWNTPNQNPPVDTHCPLEPECCPTSSLEGQTLDCAGRAMSKVCKLQR